jgi:transcriptional regulator with XRE-family HTH domain
MSSGPRRAGGLGVFLKTIRRKGRYSRRELAEAADLSATTIRDYEDGKRSPGFEAICRLSVALQVPLKAFANYIDTSRAFRLQKKQPDWSVLTFGKYKGHRMDEVPADYLHWLIKEKPRLAKIGQIEEAQRVLNNRKLIDQMDWRSPEERMVDREDERDRINRQTRKAAESDPVLAARLAESSSNVHRGLWARSSRREAIAPIIGCSRWCNCVCFRRWRPKRDAIAPADYMAFGGNCHTSPAGHGPGRVTARTSALQTWCGRKRSR